MEIQALNKIWGTSRQIFRDDRVELVKIDIVAGGFCSPHIHRYKANQFILVTGILLVMTGPDQIPLQVIAGHPHLVSAGVLHQFEAKTDCEAYELYMADPGQVIDPHDIVRFGEGGIRKCRGRRHS